MDILIVEDDVAAASLLTDSIQQREHSVENADTCKGSLEKVK